MIIALDGFKKKEVRLSDESRYMNTMILGQKGTGKSDHVLLNMVNQDLKKKQHSLFVFTSKGETSYKLYALARQAGRKVHLVKPEINTFHINLLKGSEREVVEVLSELFSYTSNKGAVSEPFYHEINKMLFVNSIKVVKRLYGEEAILEDLYDLIANINGSGRRMLNHFSKLNPINGYEKKENEQIQQWFLHEYFSERCKVFEHCISLRIQVKDLIDLQYSHGFQPEEHELPDIERVLRNKEIVIVDTEYLKYREYASLMGTYLLMKLQKALLQEETANTFVYLDDFQKFYPVATELLEGSHIHNVGVTLLLQDTKQLNRYPEYKNVLMNSVSNLILLERISIEDYYFYKDQMNAELLNRKRSEIVYKIINREGMAESTNGMLFSDERLMLNYEKYLDHKKNLIRKKKKKNENPKLKPHHIVRDEFVPPIVPLVVSYEADISVSTIATKVVEPMGNVDIETLSKEVLNINEVTPDEIPSEFIGESHVMVSKVFEQIKREGDGKEYLSADVLFEDEE